MTHAKRYAAEALELVKKRIEMEITEYDTHVYYSVERDTFYCAWHGAPHDCCLGCLVKDFDRDGFFRNDLTALIYGDIDEDDFNIENIMLRDNDEVTEVVERWRRLLVDAADEYSENN